MIGLLLFLKFSNSFGAVCSLLANALVIRAVCLFFCYFGAISSLFSKSRVSFEWFAPCFHSLVLFERRALCFHSLVSFVWAISLVTLVFFKQFAPCSEILWPLSSISLLVLKFCGFFPSILLLRVKLSSPIRAVRSLLTNSLDTFLELFAPCSRLL